MYKNLKAFRKSLGLSQREFSKPLGINLTTYSGYETGARDPNSEFWISVAKTYHVSIDYLMDCEDIKKGPTISGEAMKLAKDFDRLDAPGQMAVRAIADIELNRVTPPLEKNKASG